MGDPSGPAPTTPRPEVAGPGPRTRRAARNAAVVAAAEVAGKVATLAFTIAAARILGVEEFGAFAFALSFALLVATLPTWGFDLLLVERGSAEPGRIRLFLSEVLVWRTAIAIPVFAGAAVAGVVVRPDAESAWALVIVLLATTIDLYAEAGRAAAAALQDQVGTSTALVVQRLSVAALGIGTLLADGGLVGLSLAYLAGTAIGAVGVVVAVRRLGVGLDLRSVNRAGLSGAGRLSMAMGIDTLVSLALFRVDQVMLQAIKGDEALGAYAAAYRLLETVIFVSWAVAKAVFPVMSGSADPGTIRRGVEQGMAAVSALYLPFAVGLWVEAPDVLRLLFGEAYAADGATAARWLAAGPLLFAVGYLGSYALLALRRRWAVVWSTLAATVVNVGLNLALIPRLSGTGAAIATVASYAFEGVLTIAILARLVGWIPLHGGLGVPAVASALMAAILIPLRLPVAAEVGIGTVAYAAGWLLLARRWAPQQLAVLRSVLPRRSGTPGP